MNVLILNQSFSPDVVSVAQHAADLAAALAAEGQTVTVLASRRAYGDPRTLYPARETWRGCEIRRVWSPGLGRQGKWRRIADAFALLAAFTWALFRLPRFDVTVAMTQPPLLSVLAALWARWTGGRIVSWVMDLNPDEAIAAGWLREGSAAARLLSAAVAWSLRSSARVVVLDRFMRERIEDKGVPTANIEVIPPWSHDRHVRFNAAGRTAFRAEHGLDDRFVVMYAGNLSLVHPLATLLEAAHLLRDREHILFCFMGGGVGREAVERFAAGRRLPNLRFLPYQPLGMLGAALSAADLHTIVMGDAMVGIVHACKIYNVLAIGTPFLYVGPARSHIGDICAGLRTPGAAYRAAHGDGRAAAAAIVSAAERKLGRVPEFGHAAARFSEEHLARRLTAVVAGAGVWAPEPHGSGSPAPTLSPMA